MHLVTYYKVCIQQENRNVSTTVPFLYYDIKYKYIHMRRELVFRERSEGPRVNCVMLGLKWNKMKKIISLCFLDLPFDFLTKFFLSLSQELLCVRVMEFHNRHNILIPNLRSYSSTAAILFFQTAVVALGFPLQGTQLRTKSLTWYKPLLNWIWCVLLCICLCVWFPVYAYYSVGGSRALSGRIEHTYSMCWRLFSYTV